MVEPPSPPSVSGQEGALLEIFSKEELERTVCIVSLMGGLRGPENSRWYTLYPGWSHQD